MGYTQIENVNRTMTEVQPSVHKSRKKEKVHITVLVEGTQDEFEDISENIKSAVAKNNRTGKRISYVAIKMPLMSE